MSLMGHVGWGSGNQQDGGRVCTWGANQGSWKVPESSLLSTGHCLLPVTPSQTRDWQVLSSCPLGRSEVGAVHCVYSHSSKGNTKDGMVALVLALHLVRGKAEDRSSGAREQAVVKRKQRMGPGGQAAAEQGDHTGPRAEAGNAWYSRTPTTESVHQTGHEPEAVAQQPLSVGSSEVTTVRSESGRAQRLMLVVHTS